MFNEETLVDLSSMLLVLITCPCLPAPLNRPKFAEYLHEALITISETPIAQTSTTLSQILQTDYVVGWADTATAGEGIS